MRLAVVLYFFFTDTATTEIYTFPYTTLFRSSVRRRTRRPQPATGRVVRTGRAGDRRTTTHRDRKSTRLNSSHPSISYAVFCLKKKTEHPYHPGAHATPAITPH